MYLNVSSAYIPITTFFQQMLLLVFAVLRHNFL